MSKVIKMSVLMAITTIAMLFASGCQRDEINSGVPPKEAGKTQTGSPVYVFDGKAAENIVSVSSNGTVVFNDLPNGQLHAGDIIASAPAENAPYGFLYKVKTVSTTNEKTTVTTGPASIEEAVKKASVSEEINLNDYIVEITDADGKPMPYEAVDMRSAVEENAPQDMLRATGFSHGVSIPVELTLPIGGSDNAAVKIDGKLDFKLSAGFDVEIDGYSLDYLKFTVSPEFAAKLNCAVEGKIKGEIKKTIAAIKLAPITIPAGPVPIVFVPEIAFEVIVSVEGTVKFSATLVDFNRKWVYGVEYEDGKYNPIDDSYPQETKILEDAQLSVSGEAKVEPQLSLKFKIYNSETYFGIFGALPVKLSVEDMTLWQEAHACGTDALNPKLKLTLGVAFGLELQLEIISIKLLEFRISFNAFEWTIWERKVLPEFNDLSMDNATDVSIVAKSAVKGFKLIFPVEQYGFCWGLTANPTIAGDKVDFGALTPGEVDLPLSHTITGLDKEKTYYIRPWFRNYFGVLYGKEVSFGLERPFITTIPETVNFGEVETGYDKYESLMIENTGKAPLNISSITCSDPAFRTNWNAGAMGTVAPGKDITIFVIFAPTQERTYSASLLIKSNTDDKTVPLAGKGTESEDDETGISVYPTSLSSQMSNTSFTITNNDKAPVTVSSITAPAGCSLNWTSGVIAAGAARTVNVTFSNNNVKGTITIYSNASNGTQTVTVSELPDGVMINGVMWATRNVDWPGSFAARPESPGRFYQWGSRTSWPATGSVSGWNCDPRNIVSGYTTWSGASDPSPAGWRIPTNKELQTLWETDKVSYEWGAVENGVNGLRFTDKSSGNSIFLPFTGCRNGSIREYGSWPGIGVPGDWVWSVDFKCGNGELLNVGDWADYWASNVLSYEYGNECTYIDANVPTGESEGWYPKTSGYSPPLCCEYAFSLLDASHGAYRNMGYNIRCVLK